MKRELFFLSLFVSILFSSCALKIVAVHKEFPYFCFQRECRLRGHGNLKSRRANNKMKPSFKRRSKRKDDNSKVVAVKAVQKDKKINKTENLKISNLPNDSLELNSRKILVIDSLLEKKVVVVNDSIDGKAKIVFFVNFLAGDYNVSSEEKIIIKSYLDSITISAITKIEITGFTDSDGGVDYNQDLSFRRAEAAYKYLKFYGIPASKITIKAEGESSPQKSNNTAEGKKQNRRIEIVIAR